MKLSNMKKEGDIITFKVAGITYQFANALRRAVISEVPSMAIEEVTFISNSSILNDEVLAHRLGLLPLKTDLKTYNYRSECTCKSKGCGKCETTITMDVEGPKTVYAEDIVSADPKVVPVNPTTPIVKLTENQKVTVEAKAILGKAGDHIKWQSGIASYEETNTGFNFMIESYGQHPIRELVTLALDSFEEKINTLQKQLK